MTGGIAALRLLPDPTEDSYGWQRGLTFEQADHEIRFCDSFDRLPAILDLAELMPTWDAFRLLGEHWSSFDNVSAYADAIRALARPFRRGPIRAMMTEEEQALYDALPKTVTIYRGTDAARCREGISWSLKRSEASRFPFLYRYRTRQPVLVRARVRKSRILAIKLDRGEFEVITFAAHARMTIPLCESDVMPMAAPDGGAG